MTSYYKIIKFILILCLIMNINTKCSKGQYEKKGKCHDCSVGTFSRDGKECELCSPGTYAPFKGSKLCIPCQSGKFAYFPGSSSCDDCPEGTWSNSGSSSCYDMMKKEDASNFNYYLYLLKNGYDYISEVFDLYEKYKEDSKKGNKNDYTDYWKKQDVVQNNF